MSNCSALTVVNNKKNLPAVVEENSLITYLEQVRQIPVLTEEEERQLVYDFKVNGNLEAAQKLITSHLRLAAKIAMTYRRYGLPMADIVSEGNIGLMQAVKKFDLSKNVRLATYAMWWIKAAINDFILRSWSLVKIGTVAAQKKLFYNLNRIKARLGIYENKALEPSVVKEIAKELVVEERDVVEMNQRLGGDKSLNVSAGEDEEDEKIDFLVDTRQNIENRLANKQEQELRTKLLKECVNSLKERERYVILNRMLTEEPKTLEEIGKTLGVSRERVRQIEKSAFNHLSALVKSKMSTILEAAE